MNDNKMIDNIEPSLIISKMDMVEAKLSGCVEIAENLKGKINILLIPETQSSEERKIHADAIQRGEHSELYYALDKHSERLVELQCILSRMLERIEN